MVHGTTNLVTIGISVGLAAGVLLASLAFACVCWYKRRVHLRRCANERYSSTLPIRTNGTVSTSFDFSASSSSNSVTIEAASDHLGQKGQYLWWRWGNRCKGGLASVSGILRYSYKDIQKGTENFTTILGQGSFGTVYKAVMPAGEVVAVKVLASNSKQGEREFQTEVSLLARLHHRNLVNLVEYCVDKGQRMLIYEYMSHGSLDNLIYNDDEEQSLSWDERLQIALDISHGIEYLHDGAVPVVVHRDLKSANILLDHSMRAKVADFGLSKEQVFDGHKSGLKGTFGYIDPSYMSTNKFTTKSDVYSFGIILFELISAIRPHQNLMDYVNLAFMNQEGVDEIIDKKIAGMRDPREVRSLAKIAHKCVHKSPRKRPSMAEVSQAISSIKQRRLNKEEFVSFSATFQEPLAARLESQQLELRKMFSTKERHCEL